MDCSDICHSTATYAPVLETLDNIIAHLDVVLRCVSSMSTFRSSDMVNQLCSRFRKRADSIRQTNFI